MVCTCHVPDVLYYLTLTSAGPVTISLTPSGLWCHSSSLPPRQIVWPIPATPLKRSCGLGVPCHPILWFSGSQESPWDSTPGSPSGLDLCQSPFVCVARWGGMQKDWCLESRAGLLLCGQLEDTSAMAPGKVATFFYNRKGEGLSCRKGICQRPDSLLLDSRADSQSGFFLGSPAMDQLSSVGRGTQGQDEKSEEGVHGLKY